MYTRQKSSQLLTSSETVKLMETIKDTLTSLSSSLPACLRTNTSKLHLPVVLRSCLWVNSVLATSLCSKYFPARLAMEAFTS